MGALKLVITSIAFFFVVAGIRAEEEAINDGIVEPEASDLVLKQELEHLTSKIKALEASVSEKTRELNNKDDHITNMKKVVQEKAATISTLKKEMESLQKKGSLHADDFGKANAQAAELEKQVDNLRNELESQNRKRDALEAQASEAEKKLQELDLKMENLKKENDEQKLRIRKTERALQVAEEELMRAQIESTTKTKELTEVHGAWLPPWLATHTGYYQDLVATHWKEHAQPTLEVVLQKASERSAQAQKLLEPHMETVKAKWVPAIKDKWMILATNAEPYVQKVSIKTVEVYEASKNTIAPHIAKVQEAAEPYFQGAQKLSKPYIDHIATVTKPHVEKARVALNPYTKRVDHAYTKFLKSATTYHQQAQARIDEHLKKYELTKPLATEELVWFMASAVLALPIFFVYRLLSDILCRKKSKASQNAQAKNLHHRPKHKHTM